MSWQTFSCHTMSCYTMSYLTIPHHVLSHDVMSHDMRPNAVLLHLHLMTFRRLFPLVSLIVFGYSSRLFILVLNTQTRLWVFPWPVRAYAEHTMSPAGASCSLVSNTTDHVRNVDCAAVRAPVWPYTKFCIVYVLRYTLSYLINRVNTNYKHITNPNSGKTEVFLQNQSKGWTFPIWSDKPLSRPGTTVICYLVHKYVIILEIEQLIQVPSRSTYKNINL